MRLALFQPDIPQNLGGAIRLAACLGVGLDVIEPCGFPLSDRTLRRAAMDYAEACEVTRHDSWMRFEAERAPGRLVLMTTRGAEPIHSFSFRSDDILLMGRESAGVPDEVHNAADARLVIPTAPGTRSLNVVSAAAIALGEGLRQINAWPSPKG
ncbi:MAG: tRNA (cytidine(34)-2'-O)-methyltransferase [Proteobacteria bacterium]|nr:tRNA (cytidine(34)-2'-O)-methyltransferase [Pseudomonadota bacterium]